MPRNDGNKGRRTDVKKMIRTMENFTDNQKLLEEYGGHLTPDQLREVRHTQMKKIKYLKEMKGTIKNNGAIQ